MNASRTMDFEADDVDIFAEQMQAELDARPDKKSDGFKRMRKILSDKNERRRDRRLRTMMLKASEKLNKPANAIDWGSIDWDKIFAFFEKIIKLIMSLFA